MAIVIPAFKGKMGNTEYYNAKMPARELITGVRPADEIDEWASMSIEDKMQRDINWPRIKTELAPYIANNPDRFFGSLIVLVYKGDVFFEPVIDFTTKVPQAYKSAAKDLGFLTIDGGSLIALDGQHRLMALETVIKQKLEVSGPYMEEVPDDEISVIFIKHEDPVKTRRIFNRVNRYAKPTTRGENLMTSEDDGTAIVARRLLMDGGPFSKKNGSEMIVEYKHSTLADRSKKLTTMSALGESTHHILLANDMEFKDSKKHPIRPSEESIDAAYEVVEKFWITVLSGFEPYKRALNDPSKIPDMRQSSSPASLLFKPAAQIALVKGLAMAIKSGVPLDEAVKRATRIDWGMNADGYWKDILVRADGTIDNKIEAKNNAAELIRYLIAADKMDAATISNVEKIYRKARGNEEAALPAPVF